MNSSQKSSSSYSLERPNGSRYANIITTISVALVLLFWGMVYNKLEQLDGRLRNVEQTTNTLLYIHQDDSPGLNRSISRQPGRVTGPELNNPP